MKLIFLLTTALLFPAGMAAARPPVRIAVIDSGFYYNNKADAPLCRYGHKDFSVDRQFVIKKDIVHPVPKDVHSHGTNIVGLIDQYAKLGSVSYCFVIIKYYSDSQDGNQNTASSIRAIRYAANIHAEYVNYSGGGPQFNKKEYKQVKRYLDNGGNFIAAAGNEGHELKDGAYFPAMYDPRIVVVGNLNEKGERVKSSNYGDLVDVWEIGMNRSAYGITQSGTSQATAVTTGKMVSKLK